MSWTQVRATIVSVSALALSSAVADAQQNYLTDLGAVAPALGINNSGQVVLQNYIYSNGTLTAFPANFTGAGINAIGQVAGFSATTGTGCFVYCSATAAIYANGTVQVIPGTSTTPLPVSYPCYMPTGINDSGAVVGWYNITCGDTNAYGSPSAWLYSNGTLINLGGLAGCGVATAINDGGQISGYSPCSTEAFVIDGTQSASVLGSGQGTANAINASGQVTGNALTVVPGFEWPQNLGAVYGGGTTTLFPNAAGTGYAINASAFVVGGGVNGTNHAYLYIGAVSLDLNSLVLPDDPLRPYVTLTDARGINDTGLIVVNGVDSRGNSNHAYLLQVPLLRVTPITAFPVQAVGTTSAGQVTTLTNFGTTPIALGNASIPPGPFNIQSSTCGASLAPNAACAITVIFAPTVPGTATSALTVNASGVPPIPVPLSGVTPLSITSFTMSAPTVTAGPGNLTLTWTSSIPAPRCQLSGSGSSGFFTLGPINLASPGSFVDFLVAAGTGTFALTCTAGSQTAQAQAGPVVVVWPVVTAALSASAQSVAPHQAVTLNWSSSKAAKSCVASGGGTGDGWANTVLPTSGSKAVTESIVPASGESTTLTFAVTCKPDVAEYPGSASVKVVQKGASASANSGGQTSGGSSNGGGAFDSPSLLFLIGMLVLPRIRRKSARPPRQPTRAETRTRGPEISS